MRTFIYLKSFHDFSHNEFIEQLKIYNQISEVYLIDNTRNESDRNLFLEELSGVELDNTEYIINEMYQSFGEAANQQLLHANTEILIVSPGVRIRKEDIREMKRIYDCSEHHKFVVPRTNDGHYQTLPVDKYLYHRNEIVYDAASCIEMAQHLPDFSLLPWAEDCCVLLDGTRLFDIRGFLTDYLTMSAALKDFSIFMSDYGYNTVAANHAFAENVKEEMDETMQSRDTYKLLLRHKELLKILEMKYQQCFLMPQDYFLRLIAGKTSATQKILYFLPHLAAEYNGSAIHALMLLEGMVSGLPENWELSVVMPAKARAFFKVEQKFDLKWMEMEEIKDIYDLAFAPYHIFSPKQLDAMKQHALKIVCWPLDLINDRSNYLSGAHHIKFHEELARVCDGLIFFSEATRNDYELFFGHVKNLQCIPKRVSHIVPESLSERYPDEELPFASYYLLFGNRYRHKMMEPTIALLKDMEYNFILVGGAQQGPIAPNIYSYPSGHLSGEWIAKLYHNCKALIFPSIYEGFGLPVLQALNAGKNVYLMESELNHELESLADGFRGHIFYMNSLYDLAGQLKETENCKGPEMNLYTRSWKDVANECIEFLEQVLEQENDYDKMTARWRMAFRN